MGWFFGCFGRKNKNPRSNNGDHSLLLPQPLPFSPSQTAASIPIKNLNPLKEQVFLRTKPLSTSAPPVRLGYGILLQENAEKMSEKNKSNKKKEEDPWSQVDDLAEELEDLRKQIEKGTTAAHDSNSNQITEEVTFLKSCGALSQSPSELEKKEVETINTSSYSRGWHSWFLPASMNSSPALSKLPQPQFSVGKRRGAVQGLQVASSSSTPAKEASGIIHRRNEMKSKDNLHVGSLVTSERVMEKQNNSGNPPAVIHDPWMGESQPCDANMNVMSTPTPLKHNKVSGNASALTKQIEEHELYISCMDKSSSTKDVNASRFKSIESLKISALPSAQVMNDAIIASGTTSNTMGSHEKDDETIKTLEQVNHSCDNVISKKQSAEFVSSSVIGNHRYAAVDSTVSASQVLSESSSFSTTAENSCESPSASVSSSFNATSADIKAKFKGARNNGSYFQSDTIISRSIDSEQTVSDLNHGYCIPKYGKLKREDSVISCSSEGGSEMASYREKVATTPHQKYGSKKTSMATSLQSNTVDEGYSVDSFLEPMSSDSGENHDDPSKCVDSNGVALQPKKSESIESSRMTHHELTTTPIACYKPQRVRNQPQSPVLTPVENEVQWKKLQEKENKTTSARLKSIAPTASTKRDIPESIENNNALASRKEGWDENTYQGSKHINSYTSEKEAVVSITASFSEWSRPSKEEEGNHKTLQQDDIFHKEFIAVDMSLSHWLNPSSSSSSKQDGGVGCALVTPKNCLPRTPVLPIQPEHSPNLGQTARPILGQLSPKLAQNDRPNLYPFSGYRQQHNTCVTQTVHWDGLGIPNTTTKYNEDQKVKWFSSPFEVRLERELGKQQEAGLQKRLFGKTSGDR